MRKSIRVTSALVLVGALSLWGCSDDSDSNTGPSEGGGEGQYMKADFSGSYSGNLNATGKDMDKPLIERGEMAGAAIISEGGMKMLYMMGVERTNSNLMDPRGHAVTFIIFNPEARTYSGKDFCVEDDPSTWAAGCSVMAIFAAADEELDWEAELTGSLKITALTADRISGTFELSGEAFTRPLDLEFSSDEFDDDWEPVGKLDVKNGKYDLEIMDFEDFGDFFGEVFENRLPGEGLQLDALRGLLQGRLPALDRGVAPLRAAHSL